MDTDTTLYLVGKSLAKAIEEGDVPRDDPRESIRWVSEMLGTMDPSRDYLKLEELCGFSLAVGTAVTIACYELIASGGE